MVSEDSFADIARLFSCLFMPEISYCPQLSEPNFLIQFLSVKSIFWFEQVGLRNLT